MKKLTFLLLLTIITISLFGQNSFIKGNVFDKNGAPLVYATAVLLYPNDSTMAYYGITNSAGFFEIKNIKSGKYILQTAHIGCQSFFKNIEIPHKKNGNIGVLIMEPSAVSLSAVEVSAERIPILIKKDTIEYSAGAFNVKSDAVAEDLLKKLPGVHVDRGGNIKAQGENVQRVLVDGKEFFGSDPLVATKNLPADAVEKVQVYNKKSDETELTGIDDGTYAKTINLILKDGKKSAIFGDISAGGGTDEKYQAGAKLYRFTKKHQFAALGMLNNINKYGFSFSDYLNFNGGISSLMGGGGKITIGGDNGLPIDFGQPKNGLITSGAVGANFTYEARKNNRFNISYLANGADKKLEENSVMDNFFEIGSFQQKEKVRQTTTNRAHRLNFGWQNRIDSTQNLKINGGLSFTNGTSNSNIFSESFEERLLKNDLKSLLSNNGNNSAGNVGASYLKKWKSNWKLLKISGGFSISESSSDENWDNFTQYYLPPKNVIDIGFRNETNRKLNYFARTSVTRRIGKQWYLVPSFRIGKAEETINRLQGVSPNSSVIDSLSPDFMAQNIKSRGAFVLKRNRRKSQFSLSAGVENVLLYNSLTGGNRTESEKLYFVPAFSWHYEYSTGRQFDFSFSSSVNSPSANQLLPVVDNSNPLQLYIGNSNLKPEYGHNARINWIFFDQFSFTSIFASLSGGYTQDKINWSRTIMPDLSQKLRLVNVSDDYRANANIDFSTPIRFLGLNFEAELNESWNKGINFVDNEENINNSFNHSLGISFSNRKNEIIDVNVGGNFNITDTKYSVQNSLDKTYYNILAYTDIAYTPNEKWYFSVTADLNRYYSDSFDETIDVPLLSIEFTRYFLKNNRGVLTFEIFDVLDKNTGIERISEMNYLLERKSNTIGRYAMLTFKYRLNKFDKDSGGVKIDMKKR